MLVVGGKAQASMSLDRVSVLGQTISSTQHPQHTTSASQQESPRTIAEHASICLFGANNISLFNFSDCEIVRIRDICVKHWPQGIISSNWFKDHCGYSIKLCGRPWKTSLNDNGALGLTQSLVASLYIHNWVVENAVTMGRDRTKCHLLFRKSIRPASRRRPSWLTVSLIHSPCSSLTVHSTPEDLCTTLQQKLSAAQFLVESDDATEQPDSQMNRTITFREMTWQPSSLAQVVKSQRVLLTLTETLSQFSFSVYTTITLGQTEVLLCNSTTSLEDQANSPQAEASSCYSDYASSRCSSAVTLLEGLRGSG